MSMNRRMAKLWYIHTGEYTFKKNELDFHLPPS